MTSFRLPAIVTLAVMATAGAAPAVSPDMANMPGTAAAPAPGAEARVGRGVGIVQDFDPAARTLTLQHGPIPAIGWPAMTMTFKVDPGASMSGLERGQPVGFDVKATGMTGVITALRPQS